LCPFAGPFELSVYDLTGRQVRALVDSAWLAEGRHTYRWDGTDNEGRSLASGIYLYRLTAGAYWATRAVTLVK